MNKAKEFTYTQTITVTPYLLDGTHLVDNYGACYTLKSKTSNIEDLTMIMIDKDGKATCNALPKTVLAEIGKEFAAQAIAAIQDNRIEKENKQKQNKIRNFIEIEQRFKEMLRDPDITEHITSKGL